MIFTNGVAACCPIAEVRILMTYSRVFNEVGYKKKVRTTRVGSNRTSIGVYLGSDSHLRQASSCGTDRDLGGGCCCWRSRSSECLKHCCVSGPGTNHKQQEMRYSTRVARCRSPLTSSSRVPTMRVTGQNSGLRTKLLQISGPTRKHPQKVVQSRLSSPGLVKRLESFRPASPARSAFDRSASPANVNMMMARSEGVQTSVVSDGSSAHEAELPATNSEKRFKQNRSVSAFATKTKQMKGMISGVGKELKRAVTIVGDTLTDKIPNPTKKNSKKNARDELLGADEPLKPQVRNPDEIKRAYGHSTDARHAARMAHDKLRERGEKLSALNQRTAELESDAANFSSLAQELAKKMEHRKWYEV